TEALDYLAACADYLIGRVVALGGDAYFQIGEPWWWDNSYVVDGAPCFYDPATIAAYAAETGLPVPTPYLPRTSSDFSAPAQSAFVHWLGDKLGESTLYFRDAVKALQPSVKTMILVFTPQVFSRPMLEIVNLPVAHWAHPNFDIAQIEDYDWVIAADWAKHETTYETGFATLGYPPSKVQYFSGFVFKAQDAAILWPRIFLCIREGYARVSQTWVWARPQIWREGIIWQDAEMITVQGD
ncbi:MAG: hypothetical protein CTY36_03390, partial [Methylocystis sp.]